VEELIKAKNKYFRFCLLITGLMIAGIGLLIGGLISSLLYIWIPGVVFLVIGFYGVPILWAMYPKYTKKIAIAKNILAGILTYELLAKNASLKVKEIIPIVNTIKDKYLTQYSINETNDGLILTSEIVKIIKGHYCKFCGGKLDPHDKKCSLCGAVVTQ
jgi:hypothetical protein